MGTGSRLGRDDFESSTEDESRSPKFLPMPQRDALHRRARNTRITSQSLKHNVSSRKNYGRRSSGECVMRVRELSGGAGVECQTANSVENLNQPRQRKRKRNRYGQFKGTPLTTSPSVKHVKVEVEESEAPGRSEDFGGVRMHGATMGGEREAFDDTSSNSSLEQNASGVITCFEGARVDNLSVLEDAIDFVARASVRQEVNLHMYDRNGKGDVQRRNTGVCSANKSGSFQDYGHIQWTTPTQTNKQQYKVSTNGSLSKGNAGQGKFASKQRPNRGTTEDSTLNEGFVEYKNTLQIFRKNAERLRNLLKLPKAYRWVLYEFFYSDIDRVLFSNNNNDFESCIKDNFPHLATRKLTRVEWLQIRRAVGKPRRFSEVFLLEERQDLECLRTKIRQIQQREVPANFNPKDLPNEIPIRLVIGTKVSARVRGKIDGVFSGDIEGVHSSSHKYRIKFERAAIGSRSVVDYEVMSSEPPETMTITSIALKLFRNSFCSEFRKSVNSINIQNALFCAEERFKNFPLPCSPVDGVVGGFPLRLLDLIIRLSKILRVKSEKLAKLKQLNVEAEKLRSYDLCYPREFTHRYASCVVEVGRINDELTVYLNALQICLLEVGALKDWNLPLVIPSAVLQQCNTDAKILVCSLNQKNAGENIVKNYKIQKLVTQIASLLLQLRVLSTKVRQRFEMKSVEETLVDIRSSLEGRNLTKFQNKIEIPVKKIIYGACVQRPNQGNQ